MKWGIFLDIYQEPRDLYKCSGSIALGILAFGEAVTIIKEGSNHTILESKGNKQLSIISEESQTLISTKWWKSQDFDVVIFYSWLDPKYNLIIQAIKKAGIKVILKLDSDGRLQPPIGKQYEGFLYNMSRYIKHSLLDESKRLWQVELADAIIIESPAAAANLSLCFNYWTNNNGKNLINKIRIVGDPVTDEFINSPVNEFRDNKIVSIGRWDSYQKNKMALIHIVNKFLNEFPGYTFTIIGKGIRLSEFNQNVRDRVAICGFVSHEEVYNHLSKSRIIFTPSRYESWFISGGEALCCGCSICGTPLEPLIYLSQGGAYGTLSSNFTEQAILSALELDVGKWGKGYYNPESIARFWKPRLNKKP